MQAVGVGFLAKPNLCSERSESLKIEDTILHFALPPTALGARGRGTVRRMVEGAAFCIY